MACLCLSALVMKWVKLNRYIIYILHLMGTGCCGQVFIFCWKGNLTIKNSTKTFFFPSLCLFLFLCIKFDLIYNKKSMLHQNITPFAVHYEEICNYLRETATNSAKIHSFKSENTNICT